MVIKTYSGLDLVMMIMSQTGYGLTEKTMTIVIGGAVNRATKRKNLVNFMVLKEVLRKLANGTIHMRWALLPLSFTM